MNKRTRLFSFGVLLATTAHAGAFAQEAATADAAGAVAANAGDGLEEIVVTAERFRSTVQTTPVAISAFSPTTLQERQVTSVLQLTSQVPGLLITKATGTSNSARIVLRGAGAENGSIQFDPAVGIYIDNIYQPRINGAFFDFFDIQGIEVLRGPQGTLYGRNTSGGAIKITTLRPSLTDWSISGDAALGTFETADIRAVAHGPISDTVAVSLSAVSRKRGGTVKAPEYGRKLNNLDTQAVRGKVLWVPSERFEIEAAIDYQQDNSDPGIGVPLTVGATVNNPAAIPGRSLRTTELFGLIYQRLKSVGGSINARYSFSEALTLNSITGARDLKQRNSGVFWLSQAAVDTGNGDLNLGGTSKMRDRFFSQEFNLTVDTERLKGVTGVYYFDEEANSEQMRPYSTPNLQDRWTTAYAAFAQGTFEIVPTVGLTAGIRYTEEKVKFTQFYYLIRDYDQTDREKFKAWTPKFGINWQVMPGLFTYASYTKGFKSGGVNPISPTTNTGVPGVEGAPTPFGPEKVESYEAGFKFNTADRRIRLNVSVFEAKYEGLQLPVLFPGTSNSYTSNASNATIKGIEIEPSWRILDPLTIWSNMSFTKGKYTAPFECVLANNAVVDCSDNKIKGVIPRQISAGFNFSPDLNITGSLHFVASVDYKSKYYNNVANNLDLVQSPSAAIVNGAITWEAPSENWAVTLEGRNLLNKQYVTTALQLSNPVQPSVTAYPNDPRIVDVRVRFKF